MRLDHPALGAQAGIFHARQACELGITRGTSGRLGGSRVLPGVWSVLPPPLAPRARLFAALAYAGPGARLTGLVAAGLLGWRAAYVDEPIEALIPHDRKVRSTSFVVVTRTRCDGEMTRLGVTLALPAAILLSCARRLSQRDLTAVVAAALQRREAALEGLRRTVGRQPRRPGASRLGASLAQLAGGAESLKEVDTLAACARLGLPAPTCQMCIFDLAGTLICVCDFWWEGVAGFYDGGTHLSWSAQESDGIKRAALEALGLQVPVITGRLLANEGLLDRRLRAALRAADALRRAGNGRPQWIALTSAQARLRLGRSSAA